MKYSLLDNLNNAYPYIYKIAGNMYYFISAEMCRRCTDEEVKLYCEMIELYKQISSKEFYETLDNSLESVKRIAELYDKLRACVDISFNTQNHNEAEIKTAELLISLTEEENDDIERQYEVFCKINKLIAAKEIKENAKS